MSERPEIGSRWLHKKSGGRYRVKGYCMLEHSFKPGILYVAHPKHESLGYTWCRDLDEFLDGRFVPIVRRIKAAQPAPDAPESRSCDGTKEGTPK